MQEISRFAPVISRAMVLGLALGAGLGGDLPTAAEPGERGGWHVADGNAMHPAHGQPHGMDPGESPGHSHSPHGNGHGHHHGPLEVPAGVPAPTLRLRLYPDPVSGYNLELQTVNFDFAPEQVNQPPVQGQGHGHLYINGEKVSRVYGPWLHIPSLPVGINQIEVTLNANDHRVLAVDGEKVAAMVTVSVP